MKIDELDECQGLTADMVREWLTAQKATFRDGHWTHPNGKYRYKDGEYGGLLWSLTLSQIAADFDKPNEQALLREINPRMRKGWPSDPALAAHSHWMARHAKLGCIIVGTIETDPDWGPGLVSRTTRLDKSRSEGWEFWPCDEYGSKVRWPVDAEGKML